MKTITVEVKEDGSIKIEAAGFTGNACTKATEAIEKALGVASGPRKHKPEFYQQQQTGQTAKQ